MDEKNMNGEAMLLSYSIKYGGDWEQELHAITKREHVELSDVTDAYNKYKDKFITAINENYPEYLRKSRNAPFVLYYRGYISMIKEYKNKLSVFVGLSASMYAKNSVSKLLKDLIGIVIPVIPYVDRWSLDTALEITSLGGRVVLVLAKGFGQLDEDEKNDIQKIAEHGLVISEFPDDEKSKRVTRFQQTRLVANLATNSLVGAITKQEYQMIGIGYSMAKDDNVFCIPFQLGSNYVNNSLIHDGAILVEDKNTIVFDGEYNK